MTEFVKVERIESIGVITIDHPPVNALAYAVRTQLLAGIERLDSDTSVRALVIGGAGKNFIAGADVREFDAPPKTPLLVDVLNRLEACGKPVVAALHGACLGGGAETALASHYRCASRDLQLGFPEVKLGLLPGAGGTVRLPRLVGFKTALDLMTSGEPIGFERAMALGLIDATLEGDTTAGAIEFAKQLLARGEGARRLSERSLHEAAPSADFFANYKQGMPARTRRLLAPARIVDALQAAAEKPFAEALATARTFFAECVASTESRAFRHLFFAERGKSDAGTALREVRTVGVVGAGTMGSGIAISFLTAGFDVTLVDTEPRALAAGEGRVAAAFDGAVSKGRMSAAEAAAAKARFHPQSALTALSACDFIVEAVIEKLAVKEAVFADLGRIAKPGAILATNTSTLDVDAIAAASGRPADVIGMHFFSPANIMRLVEIVRGKHSAPDVAATVAGVTKRLGKLGVVVGNAFGFVGNRMLYAYGYERERMLLEGATPEQIDEALENFGMAMGPNAVADLAGLDIGYHARREWKERPSDPRYFRVSDALVELGRLGQKTGMGFYRYEGAEKKRIVDPAVVPVIRAEAERLGIAQRAIAREEIVERCLRALAREGERLVKEGVAASAADIDVIWCNGYGFPRFRGGPMFYAQNP